MTAGVTAVITGRGGQGTKLAAQLLAWAGAADGFSPLHYSVYDGLIRGGDIASTVVLGANDPGPPIRDHFDVMVAVHAGWFERYYPAVRAGGHLFYDPTYIDSALADREDVSAHPVSFGEVAASIGDWRAANMVAAGVLAGHWSAPSLEALQQAVRDVTPAHRADRVDANVDAVKIGWELGAESTAARKARGSGASV